MSDPRNPPFRPDATNRVQQGAANAPEILQMGGFAGPTGPAVGGQMVYMGPNFRGKPSAAEQRQTERIKQSPTIRHPSEAVGRTVLPLPTRNYDYASMQEASDYYFLMPPKQREQFHGYYQNITGSRIRSVPSFINGWNQAVTGSAEFTRMTGRPTTPMEYAQMLANVGPGVRPQGGRGGGSRGPTRTEVINLTNPSDARVLVDNALTQYLGRRATQEESRTFLKTLNKLERKSPQISVESGDQTRKVVQEGGLNQELVAREFAESREDAAEFMVQSQYMNWFTDLLARDPAGRLTSGL